MKNRFNYIIVILLATLGSCSLGGKIDEASAQAETILADKEFKDAIALIELHKTRYGEYPESLSDLKHINAFHETLSNSVDYDKIDSGYKLDLIMEFPSFESSETKRVKLEYGKEFWQGLGCVKSNTMIE